jgi:hypothetical protein
MGFFDSIKKLLTRQKTESITQSLNHSINHSLAQSQLSEPTSETQIPPIQSELTSPVELQRESLQLGIAAGYTGKTLREIESSLSRIETFMVSKDWMTSKLDSMAATHESNEQHRFETLVSIINSLHEVARSSPPPIQTRIIEITKRLEEHGKITPRMQQLIDLVKELKEISYTDLAIQLGLRTEDGLRGLLSLVCRHYPNIQRFEKEPGRRKWVKYVENTSESLNQSLENQSESQEKA